MAGLVPANEFHPPDRSPIDVRALADAEPPARSEGGSLFRKNKLLPVLSHSTVAQLFAAARTGDCAARARPTASREIAVCVGWPHRRKRTLPTSPKSQQRSN